MGRMDIERAKAYRAAWGMVVRYLEAPERYEVDGAEPCTAGVRVALAEIAPGMEQRISRLVDLHAAARLGGWQLTKAQASMFMGLGCLVEIRYDGQPDCWIVDPDVPGGAQLLALLKAGRKEA
jgi:hypothetical protein